VTTEAEARAIWDANPHLAWTHADFGAFLQARSVLAFRHDEDVRAELDDITQDHEERRSLALARLRLVDAPMGIEDKPRIWDRQGTRLVLWVYGPIGGANCHADARVIVDALNDNKDAAGVVVRIASAGGYEHSAVNIYNALVAHPGRVIAIVDKFAYSAASLIACAAHRVCMRRDAAWMTHRSWNTKRGNADEFATHSAALRVRDDQIAKTMAARRRISVHDMRMLMKTSRYLSATEALEAGVCDAITQPLPIPNADWDTPLPKGDSP